MNDPLDKYNVVWNTPSRDSAGSMPIGNGDIGLNVWVEENGDLVFYISKTDAWSENSRLLKLGRVRVKLTPNPFAKAAPFEQILRLRQGEITISGGEGENAIALRIWVDANNSVIRLEAEGSSPFELQAALELWRTQRRELGSSGHTPESDSACGAGPFPVYVYPDTILPDRQNRIVWYHRNLTSMWPENMKMQGLGDFMKQSADPLLNRTFGAAIKGDGLVTVNETTLKSAEPGKQQTVSIYPLTGQTATIEDWSRQLDRQISSIEAVNVDSARKAHRKWWNNFWNRSWIHVSGIPKAAKTSQAYALQRFVNACGGRGAFPIKFNGSIFTVDSREPTEQYNADYRRWGGGYWFQNTRLIYWPMMASGDFDMMQPFFRMYIDALPLAKERNTLFFDHAGVLFPETMTFWGSYRKYDYGWDRANEHISYVRNGFIKYYWQGGLELSLMMLDFYAYTQDDTFARETLVPLASEILTFFDKHWGRDENGNIRFEPASALETYHVAINPLVEIVGIRKVAEKMLALPETLTTSKQRSCWTRLIGQLPAIPTQTVDRKKVLAPAEKLLSDPVNSENPTLYAVFPYRLYGVGKPELEIARRTFAKRRVKQHICWYQDDIQAAYLGQAEEASKSVSARFAETSVMSKDPKGSRFPVFWGPGNDWIPDQDHGGVGLMALQAMLLQAEGDKILLFPAWPKDWDVDFKLHAPYNTVVSGHYRNGKLEKLDVVPSSRKKDIEILKQMQSYSESGAATDGIFDEELRTKNK